VSQIVLEAPGQFSPTLRAARRAGLPALFLLPSFLLYVVFALIPITETVRISFYKWDGFSPAMPFVATRNYAQLAGDPAFWNAAWHNIEWLVLSLFLAVSTAMAISAVLARLQRGRTFFRVTFFLPNVVSLAVVAVIWGQLYDPLVGPITLLLNHAGLGSLAHLWLGDPATVLPAINVGNSWQSYGFYMVILLAGLQGIDVTLYEAATVDGAGAWSLFWHITIPGLRNVLNLVLILAFINALHGFTMVWVMTQGGPMLASDLLATYIYRVAFGDNNLGVATAASVVLSIVVILTTLLFNRLREEEIG
jgi:raffinose/stachyose/melibiose transport system permease protein